MIKDATRTAALMVGGPTNPAPVAALKASQALRTARYSTALGVVQSCFSLGTVEEAAMADSQARQRLLRSWPDLAAEWAREEVLRQLEHLAANRQELPEQEIRQRRGQLWQVLQRISPGKCSSPAMVRAAGGSLKSDPREQAEALTSHWAGVFSAMPVDQNRVQQWLARARRHSVRLLEGARADGGGHSR